MISLKVMIRSCTEGDQLSSFWIDTSCERHWDLVTIIVMTSRRKSKRSVSLRTSSFIRKLSPFQRGPDREADSPGDQALPVESQEDGGFCSGFLQTALSDPQLHVSSLVCSGTGPHIPHIIRCHQTLIRTQPYLPTWVSFSQEVFANSFHSIPRTCFTSTT